MLKHGLRHLQPLANGKATLRFELKHMATLLLVLLMTGCSGHDASSRKENAPTSPMLKIAHGHWPGFDIAHYGNLAGLFKKRGINVEFIRLNNQYDATRQLARGRVDAAFSSASDLFQNPELTQAHQIILITNVSNGADGIVAQKGITTVKDLVGKQVSAKINTVNEIILLEALDKYEVQAQKVDIEDISNESAYQRFIAGELDAAVLWEPLLTEAANKSDGQVIFRTNEVNSLVIDCLITDQNTINKRQKDFKAFALAWLDIMHAVQEKPNSVFEMVAKEIDQEKDAFQSDYQGLKKGSINLNHSLLVEGQLKKDMLKLKALLSHRHQQPPERPQSINASIIKYAIDSWKPLP